MTKKSEGRCLGLIGGLGPGATIHYYQALIAAHAARGQVARMLIAHADLDRVLTLIGDNDPATLAQYLSRLIRQMADGGAEVAAISAIAPHICLPELLPLSPLPLVDLVAETGRVIRAKGLKRVALFGTRFAVETRLFGRLDGAEIVKPSPEDLAYIHDAYLQIVKAGRGSDAIFSGLRQLAHKFCERDGAEAIVLAGTELSLVFDEANTDFPAIDCARVHVEAIMERLFSQSR